MAALLEHHRAEVLYEQAEGWRRAGELRTYVEAMKQKAAELATDDERSVAAEWIEWAARFAERLDLCSIT